MARNLKIGESVYVPSSKFADQPSTGIALRKTEVLEKIGKMAKVKMPNGMASEWIGVSLLHREVGILVINIGDFETEHFLLDPLAKSVGQFCRLLVPDDQIKQIRIRSLEELKKVWKKDQAVYSHVVWIAHGKTDAIKFGVDEWIEAEKLVEDLRIHGAPKKVYISLCCKTGYKAYGATLSRSAICSHFNGPFQSVEGAVASQFCQSFLAYHLLDGQTVGVAFKHARENIPGGVSFRLWENGDLTAGPKTKAQEDANKSLQATGTSPAA
jgi:hypothetical protein